MQIHIQHLGNYHVPEQCRDGICVDIGGNTGQFSLKYANFFKTIHIYEPQKECQELISKNIKNISNMHMKFMEQRPKWFIQYLQNSRGVNK